MTLIEKSKKNSHMSKVKPNVMTGVWEGKREGGEAEYDTFYTQCSAGLKPHFIQTHNKKKIKNLSFNRTTEVGEQGTQLMPVSLGFTWVFGLDWW